MLDIHLHLLGREGTGDAPPRLRVRTEADPGEEAVSCDEVIFFHFLYSEKDRQDLNWYFEDYCVRPFPKDRPRADIVVRRMKEIGEDLFLAAFGHPATLPIYAQVRDELSRVRLTIHTPTPDGISLPWELIQEPGARKLEGLRDRFLRDHGLTGDAGPVRHLDRWLDQLKAHDDVARGELARLLGGFIRGPGLVDGEGPRPPAEVPAAPPLESDSTLNVLLIICRPAGEGDVPFRSVALPLVDVLRTRRHAVRLHVLRPPTFEQLQEDLSGGDPQIHIVHFDGHGSFPEGNDPDRRGGLVFEDRKGEADVISGDAFRELLAEHRVTAVVLNACQSNMTQPGSPYPSLGQDLVDAGVPAVVAMAYAVGIEAAVLFMARFYEVLSDGEPLDRAAREARNRVWANRNRETPFGKVEIRDWPVPVYLERSRVRLVVTGHGGPRAPAVPADDQCPPPPDDELIGRDGTFLRIERALRSRPPRAVVLEGKPGIGKTSVAVEFARWWIATSGGAGAIVFFNGRERCHVGAIVDRILELAGEAAEAVPAERRREAALEVVRDRVGVLIIDDIRQVLTLAPEAGRGDDGDYAEEIGEVLAFLEEVLAGDDGTRVLVTARERPAWLFGHQRVELRGLAGPDAQVLISRVLSRNGIDREPYAWNEDYLQLVQYLATEGYPEQIISTLPRLANETPLEIYEDKVPPAPTEAPLPRPGWLLPAASWTFAVSVVSLSAAYYIGSWGCQYWNTMFNRIPGFIDPPPHGVFGIGYFAEVGRAAIIIFVGMILIIFGEFRAEAMTLLPGPLKSRGDRPAAPFVGFFRGFFAVMGIFIAATLISHHLSGAPLKLWRQQGMRGVAEADLLPIPPTTAEEVACHFNCRLAYGSYVIYSLINWLICFDVMLSVVLFVVASDIRRLYQLWEQMDRYRGDPRRTLLGIRAQFNRIVRKARTMLERYFSLVAFLLFALAYLVLLDRHNLEESALQLFVTAILALLAAFLGLLGAFVFFHDRLVATSLVAIPEEERGQFRALHRLLPLLRETTLGSSYFKPMAGFAAAALAGWLLWHFRVVP